MPEPINRSLLGIIPPDVATMPPEMLPALAMEIAAIQGAMAARMASVPVRNGGDSDSDEMVNAKEAARRTGMSQRLLYKKAKAGELPFARRVSARAVRFSARGIERWLAGRKAAAGMIR